MLLQPRLGFILACIFLNALGIGLIVPVLPRLIGTLTESAGAQTIWYGALMVSYGLMQFLSAPILGALSDRIGRRPVLLGGIFGLGLMFAVPAFCSDLTAILLSRIAGGVLSANMAVAQAYIADITDGASRTAAFGRIGAVFGIGFVVGPAAGGILGAHDPALPFAVASVVALINFLYGAFVLPESLTERSDKPMSFAVNNPIASLRALLSVPQNRCFAVTLLISSLANSLTQCTWALYTEYRYGFTPLEIGLSVFALGLSISAAQGFALQYALRRHDPLTIAVAVLAVGATALGGVALTPEGISASVLFCLFAITGTVSPILTGAVSRCTPITMQGKVIGSLMSLNSLTSALAPVLGTPLLMVTATHKTNILAGAPFLAAAVLIAASLAILSAGVRHIRRLEAADARLPLDED